MADGTDVARPADSKRAAVATGVQGQRNAAGGDLARRRVSAAPTENKPRTIAESKGGSSSTMMRLYTNDETEGLKVDPLVVLVLAVVFIFSVVILHLLHKVVRIFSK